MDHLAMRQQVLPSLVSQEDSASMSLLSNSLSTWGNPSIRPIWSLFSLSRGRSVPPCAGARHPEARPGLQRGHAAHSQWLTSSGFAPVAGERGSQHKGLSVRGPRGWRRALRGHLRAKLALFSV